MGCLRATTIAWDSGQPGVVGSRLYHTYSVVVEVSGSGTVALLNLTVEHQEQYMGYVNAGQVWCGRRGNRQPKMRINER